MLKSKILGTGTAVLLAGALGMVPGAASANAAPVSTAKAVAAAQPADMVQTVTGALSNGTTFTGTLSDLRTTVDRATGTLNLVGTITGTGDTATDGESFTAPISNLATNAGCTILTLDLGPLFLDLLGLQVDLAPINLDITAVPGPGNLLGNLLCAVAGLLDGPGGALGGLAALLNRLLSGLGLAA
ncbi:ABC transporter substrate-binding protein [Knoellia sp. CPCC 206435]|uniref:ABC transporter substrate-binding protein n=1 Tax=Knoellia terrae TaxID=3404797 RepID=UPI003B4336FB